MDADDEVFVCIWLQSQSKELADKEKLSIEELQKKDVPSIKVFDDPDECCNYILSLPDGLIFLRLGQGRSYFVELMNGFDQIKCFYLSEKSEYGYNPKVRGVFPPTDAIDYLYFQLSKDSLKSSYSEDIVGMFES